MQNISGSNYDFEESASLSTSSITVKKWFSVLIFAVVGFATPLIYAYFNGFPVPHAHDELSYTVAADTYAHGRLTNPTPAHFKHFETPHIIVEPSYISKYPPMQGLFLAAGQIIFGNQIFGVWLSCGFFAAALFWMLSVWTKREWAIGGTISMILFIGINSYWSQSFWGGMIAAAGGALFFGGFRQIFKQFAASSTVLMVLGGIILVNSRPFEGTISMLPALFVLFVWLLRDKIKPFSQKFKRVVLPGLIVAGLGISAMCYQYYRVTGSAFTMPYSIHHAQYYPMPLFSFQSVNPAANRGNPRIRQIYEKYTMPVPLELAFESGFPDSPALRSVYGFLYLTFEMPMFLFPFLFVILFSFSVVFLVRLDRWLLLIGLSIVFTFACMSLAVWWDQFHYAAPLTACFFLLLVEGMRYIFESVTSLPQRRKIIVALTLLIFASYNQVQLLSLQRIRMGTNFAAERALLIDNLTTGKETAIRIPERATFFKYEFEKLIEEMPDRYIAVVTYDPNYNFHDEIVYNKADIENAKLIWAHDLGEEKNRSLLEHYNNRKILLIKIASNTIDIKPVSNY